MAFLISKIVTIKPKNFQLMKNSDIESLAKFAYEKNNFGIAIEIIQSLLQLIPNSKSKINDNFIKNLEK